MRFPELRVTRTAGAIQKVEWDPCRDGRPVFDITDLWVTAIEKVLTPEGLPEAKLTILARLVEIEDASD